LETGNNNKTVQAKMVLFWPVNADEKHNKEEYITLFTSTKILLESSSHSFDFISPFVGV